MPSSHQFWKWSKGLPSISYLKPGEIRPIERRGPDGQKFIDFIGRESFVKDMTRPGRRVVSFTTDRGKFDAIRSKWM